MENVDGREIRSTRADAEAGLLLAKTDAADAADEAAAAADVEGRPW